MSSELTGRYRLRLVIGLPLVVICFTLAAGFLPLGMFDYSLSRVERPMELRSLLLNLKIAVLVITLVATTLAVALSLYIVRPVERIIKEMEDLAKRRGASPDELNEGERGGGTDEIDRLSKLYDRMFVPMSGYLTTADLFLQMSEGVVSLNANGKIAFLNAPIERLLAIDRRQYIGRHYGELFPNSGRNFEIHELIKDVLGRGLARTRECLVSTPSGRDIYVRTTASPSCGSRQQAIGVVMLFQDIEVLSRVKDQLRRMDVLASIGSTIAGMAHEVKTPLGYIRGLAELIQEDLPKEAPQQKYVETIMDSVDRLNVMVQDILSLASVKIDKTGQLDPVQAIRESILYLRDKIEAKKLRLIEDYPAVPAFIRADRHKLVESFINILKNACEAAPEGAALSVRVRQVSTGSSESADESVIIDFHNEGSYIPAETKEKLFTPFFTTKKQGTGLGLAISRQIIQAHGGAIDVESGPETGTLFRILLPANSSSAMLAESAVQ